MSSRHCRSSCIHCRSHSGNHHRSSSCRGSHSHSRARRRRLQGLQSTRFLAAVRAEEQAPRRRWLQLLGSQFLAVCQLATWLKSSCGTSTCPLGRSSCGHSGKPAGSPSCSLQRTRRWSCFRAAGARASRCVQSLQVMAGFPAVRCSCTFGQAMCCLPDLPLLVFLARPPACPKQLLFPCPPACLPACLQLRGPCRWWQAWRSGQLCLRMCWQTQTTPGARHTHSFLRHVAPAAAAPPPFQRHVLRARRAAVACRRHHPPGSCCPDSSAPRLQCWTPCPPSVRILRICGQATVSCKVAALQGQRAAL
jgi:hypothetical protein